MAQGNLDDLRSLIAVAREHSFTKAAGKLGVSQSGLSRTIRQIEERVGVRLVARTTRSVSLTEAGQRLVDVVAPRFEEIEAEMDALTGLREKPAGIVRITAGDHAIRSIIWPKLQKFLPDYPDINVDIVIDYGLTDIVAERFDAGVRWGEQITKDMIAVRIGPDVRFIVVGSEAYFERNPIPVTPNDLTSHKCVNLRLPTYGGTYVWEFEKDGQQMKARVEGQLTFNSIFEVLDATVAGFGLGFVPEDIAKPHLVSNALSQVLEDWSPPWSGYHLYYPHRRQFSPALALVVDALRQEKN